MMTKRIGLVFWVIFLLPLWSSISQAAAISGNIALPGGQTASGAMFINIAARDVSGNELPYMFTNVTIAAGTNNVNFSLDSIPDDAGGSWQISYGCFSNFEACRDYVMSSYYDNTSAGNVSYKVGDATPVAQGSSGINFEVLQGITLSGSLTAPAGPAPAEGIDTQIFFFSTDSSVSETIRYSIDEGDNSFDFSAVLPNDAALSYRVRYQCDPVNTSSGVCSSIYLTNGYYQSTATDNTVASSAEAQSLVGNSSNSMIDMTLIPGASVSGEISRIAAAGNANPVFLSVVAEDQSGGEPNGFKNIEIASGEDSAEYTVVVTPNPASSWIIRVACSSFVTEAGCSDYGQFTYYDADTPVTFSSADVADADQLSGDTTHANIDMTLVGKKTISGHLMLPGRLLAPKGGTEFNVAAQRDTSGGGAPSFDSVVVTIPPGATSIPYSVPFADIDGAEWLLSVNCNDFATPIGCAAVAAVTTYYDVDNSPSFTTLNRDEADLLSGAQNNPGTNLTLIAASPVSGVIALGSGQTAPQGDLVVRMIARGYKDGVQEYLTNELFTVTEGQSQVAYSISLAHLDLDGYTLEISCDQNNPVASCEPYFAKSYFVSGAQSGSSQSAMDATLISLDESNNDADMTLLAESAELCLPIKASNGSVSMICL